MLSPDLAAGLARGLGAAVAALRAGLVVAIPTDTVYGIAADPFHPGATARIFAAKGRPEAVVLPVLVAGMDQALELVEGFPGVARALAERFWPGPLTLVLRRRPEVALELGGEVTDLAGSGATIGLRWPDHPVPEALCQAVGPLATTSANLHGRAPATTAADVIGQLGGSVAAVVDGGRCDGAPSTVVDCTGPDVRLIREGRIPWAEVVAPS